MNRRQVFKVIAAVPLIGGIVSQADALPLPETEWSLMAWRDLLLPGLWGSHNEGGALCHPRIWQSDIHCNFADDYLVVKAITNGEYRIAVGKIMRHNLSTMELKSKFIPLLERMRDALLSDNERSRYFEFKMSDV